MSINFATTPLETIREARLAVLASLSWLLLLPLGWFLTYSPLARQTVFRTALGLAYLAVAFYKLLRSSKFFRNRDWITLAFMLLALYVLAFATALLWFWLAPPAHAGDWAISIGLVIMSGLFVSAGIVLVLAPRMADKLSQLSQGPIFLEHLKSPPKGLRIGRRISGAFLLAVRGLVLSLVVNMFRDLLW
jgi:hypothetical protein